MLVSEFLTQVRTEGKVTSAFTDAQLCALADSEIASRFVPLVRNCHNDYFVREATLASVDGRVRLPDRAVAGSLRHAQLVLNGRASDLPLYSLEEDHLAPAASIPCGYYMDAGGMILLPRGTNGTVRIRYFCKPAKLREETNLAARLTSVSYAGSGVATCGFASTTWTGGITLDVISGGPNHELLVQGATQGATSITATVAQQLGGVINTSDYVCETGYTPMVPLPEELYSALIHQVAAAYLRGMAYLEESTVHQKMAEVAMDEAKLILAPRNEGNIKKLKGGIRRALGQGW